MPAPVTVSAPGPVRAPENRSAKPPLSIVPPPAARVSGRALAIAALVSRVAAIERERGAGRAEAGIGGDRDRPCADGGAAGVAVGAGQRQRAGADLAERSAAADRAGEGERVAAVEQQRAIVGDIAGEAAGGRAGADLEGAGSDGGAAGIAVGAGQGERSARRAW